MEQKKPTNRGGKKPAPSAKPATGKATANKQGKAGTTSSAGSAADYVFGWLGRQVGHVKKAVQADVTKPAGKSAGGKPKASGNSKPAAGRAKPPPKPTPAGDGSAVGKVIYRQDKIEEAELPHQPGVILRRTIIDEVVVERVIEEPPEGT